MFIDVINEILNVLLRALLGNEFKAPAGAFVLTINKKCIWILLSTKRG